MALNLHPTDQFSLKWEENRESDTGVFIFTGIILALKGRRTPAVRPMTAGVRLP
jgi:hypothetical protein